jgi:AcrR family transcriptional regulator
MVQTVPDTDTPKRKTRTGGRSGRVRQAVLDAAFEALRDDGYEKLSIVRVAAAAGVHETSIYRRWGGKGALLMDVCLSKAADAIPTPDTGSIQSDLDQLVGQVVRVLKSHDGRALSSAVLAARDNPNLRSLSQQFWTQRLGLAQVIFERAEQCGKIRGGLDFTLLLEMLIGPLYFRALVSGEPLSTTLAHELVELLLVGLQRT